MTTESITDVFTEQARINKKKRNLQRRDDQTARDWLELVEEYRAIDSRANMAFCQQKAVSLVGYKAEEISEAASVFQSKPVEEKEEWWQK